MTASTTVVGFSTKKRARKLAGPGVVAMTYDLTLATGDLEQDDIEEVGYVPGNVTVIAFLVTATDMDTGGSPAMVFDVQLGTTALVVGSTLAQAGGSSIYACTPTTTTAPTVVRFKTTTAPATAAGGTVQITVLYFSA